MTETTCQEIRPWGSFEVLLDEPAYKVKRITVLPGKRLSLQYHRRRLEHWVVVTGSGVVTLGNNELPAVAGSVFEIPRETAHRILNTGEEPLVFIEVQRGDYFGEDDIVRLDDDFGRIANN